MTRLTAQESIQRAKDELIDRLNKAIDKINIRIDKIKLKIVEKEELIRKQDAAILILNEEMTAAINELNGLKAELAELTGDSTAESIDDSAVVLA